MALNELQKCPSIGIDVDTLRMQVTRIQGRDHGVGIGDSWCLNFFLPIDGVDVFILLLPIDWV